MKPILAKAIKDASKQAILDWSEYQLPASTNQLLFDQLMPLVYHDRKPFSSVTLRDVHEKKSLELDWIRDAYIHVFRTLKDYGQFETIKFAQIEKKVLKKVVSDSFLIKQTISNRVLTNWWDQLVFDKLKDKFEDKKKPMQSYGTFSKTINFNQTNWKRSLPLFVDF